LWWGRQGVSLPPISLRGSGFEVPKVVLSSWTKSKVAVYIGIWFILPMVYPLISYLFSLSLFHINPLRMGKKNTDQDGVFLGSVSVILGRGFLRLAQRFWPQKWARTLFF
jgi:hypothetical protein